MVQVLRESLRTPRWIERELRNLGTNLYDEPIYRLSWGWSRLSWIGGKWEDSTGQNTTVEFEMRLEPKYVSSGPDFKPTFDRWFLEKWLPPETYGPPERWYEQTIEWEDEVQKSGRSLYSLGPFPSRGDYELSYTLETRERKFLAPTYDIIRYLIYLIETSRLVPRSKRLAALREREQKKYEAEIARNEDILSDVSPFFKRQYITVP